MAANIEFNELKGTYSYVENGKKERAWHGLGQVYDKPLTVIEALEGCNADFEVGLQPIVALTPELIEEIKNGGFGCFSKLEKYIIKEKSATMRLDSNETLGVVSSNYGVVQNKHAFDFVDMICTGELGGATPVIESAGLLGNGERIFITAKFPEPVRLAGKDDVIDMYVVFTTSHDGTGAVTCMVTPVRVVCNNTLNLALQHNSGKLCMRHTSHILDRLDLTNKENAQMAYKTLNLYNTYKEFFEVKLEELAKLRITDKEAEQMLAKALFSQDGYKAYKDANFSLEADGISTRALNQLNAVQHSLHSGVGQDILEKGTGLWLVNGLTTYFQNEANFGSDEKKFKSITEGPTQDKLQSLYDSLSIKLVA